MPSLTLIGALALTSWIGGDVPNRPRLGWRCAATFQQNRHVGRKSRCEGHGQFRQGRQELGFLAHRSARHQTVDSTSQPKKFRSPAGSGLLSCRDKKVAKETLPPDAGPKRAPLCASLAAQLHTRGLPASRVKAPPSWRRPSAWLARSSARRHPRGWEELASLLLPP